MSTSDDVRPRLELVKRASRGELDGLPCPDCGVDSVTVKFTSPDAGQYRTWFVCLSCDFTMRTQNSGRPAHFDAERVDSSLERMDRS